MQALYSFTVVQAVIAFSIFVQEDLTEDLYVVTADGIAVLCS